MGLSGVDSAADDFGDSAEFGCEAEESGFTSDETGVPDGLEELPEGLDGSSVAVGFAESSTEGFSKGCEALENELSSTVTAEEKLSLSGDWELPSSPQAPKQRKATERATKDNFENFMPNRTCLRLP